MATITTVFTTINGMLVHEDRGGVETEYVSDPLGSLVQIRNSSGTKTYSAEYWPYGELQTSTGTNPSSWGYVGLLGYLSDVADRLYVRARYYLTKVCRWQTVDPLWPGELPYQYVGSNPVSRTDRSGLGTSFWEVIAKCGTGIGNLIGDLVNGKAIDGMALLCGMGVPCALAIIDILIEIWLGEFGPLATCLAGAINGLLASIAYNLCHPGDPCKLVNNILCNLVNSLMNGLTGCLSSLGGSISVGLGTAIGTFSNFITNVISAGCKPDKSSDGSGLVSF